MALRPPRAASPKREMSPYDLEEGRGEINGDSFENAEIAFALIAARRTNDLPARAALEIVFIRAVIPALLLLFYATRFTALFIANRAPGGDYSSFDSQETPSVRQLRKLGQGEGGGRQTAYGGTSRCFDSS